MKQLTLMKCSFAYALVEAQQLQFLLLDIFKRIISQNTGNCIWYLWIWKRPLIDCLKRYFGGLFVLLVYCNGYFN